MGLSFDELRKANTERCEASFHPVKEWSPMEWAAAMAGECGEACGEVKVLRRLHRDFDVLKSEPPDSVIGKHVAIKLENLGRELADIICYADLLAARVGIDLGEAVRQKFNEVSARVESNVRL